MAHTLNSNSSAASVFAYRVVVFFERLGQKLAERRTRK